MRKIAVMCSLALVAAVTSQASAQYQWFENFEDGLAGWNLWTQRGTNLSVAENEPPVLGNEAGWSGANQTVAHVGGAGFNGGIWQVINLPLGAGTYQIDGYWRSHPTIANQQWGEVIVLEGAVAVSNANDYTAPLIYKNDTFATPAGWSGKISSTAPVTNIGPNFTTASGTITLILKSGNSSATTGVDFDDISITPEPATAAMLALAGLPLLRRRRRQA